MYGYITAKRTYKNYSCLHFLFSSSKIFLFTGLCQGQRACFSMISFDDGKDNNDTEDDFVEGKKDLEPQGVDPDKGWNFRGVHKVMWPWRYVQFYCKCNLSSLFFCWTSTLISLSSFRQLSVAKLVRLLYRRY